MQTDPLNDAESPTLGGRTRLNTLNLQFLTILRPRKVWAAGGGGPHVYAKYLGTGPGPKIKKCTNLALERLLWPPKRFK